MRALISALLAWTLAACSPAPSELAHEPAIWRITDADSEIWLYGSSHLLPPSLRWRGPKLEAAFAAAEELVAETDTSADTGAVFVDLAQRYGRLPAGESLSARLSPEDAARLAQAARSLGLDPAALDQQRPWLTALQLSVAAATRAGHSAEAGVESVLTPEARARGMRLSYLETAEQQVQVLAGLPPEEEARFFSLTLRDIDQGAALMAEMDDAWVRGDVAALERLLEPQWREAGPIIHDAVIIARNRAWADDVTARLEGSGSVFIVVGAAHLVGEDSLVDLLRERGIAVEGP